MDREGDGGGPEQPTSAAVVTGGHTGCRPDRGWFVRARKVRMQHHTPWKRDLGAGSLLDEQPARVIKQKHAERSVQHAGLDVHVEVGCRMDTAA